MCPAGSLDRRRTQVGASWRDPRRRGYPPWKIADGRAVAGRVRILIYLTGKVACFLPAEASGSPNCERAGVMTKRADFTQEEWELVLEGPPSAGMIVVTAQRGGTIRETLAIAKAYVEARRRHGESELLDEIVAAKPEIDHTRYHSVEELKQHGLQHLRDAVVLLEHKATPAEVEEYKHFVITLAEKVAEVHREGGSSVSDAEHRAVQDISAGLAKGDL